MSGFGPAEILVVLLILLVLFGPTLIAFWLGYTLGSKRSARPKPATSAVARASVEEADAKATDETTAETTTDEEPAREEPFE